MRLRKTGLELARNADGKGTVGCLLFLLLAAAALFAGIRVGPDYYSYKSLEGDVRTEVSRAGAHFYGNEAIVRNILDLARKNEVRLKKDDIKVERFAGQVFVTIRYSVPLDLVVYEREIPFEIKASSFVGAL